MALKQTPSQTVGPFFAYGLTAGQYGYPYSSIASGTIANEDDPGARIRVAGRVLDGAGAPISDAVVEIWQADCQGRYAHPADGRGSNTGFKGFGRFGTGTDPENRFRFETVKPGLVDGVQAPHLNVIILMRGLLVHAYTHIYFGDEGEANARDPILLSVPEERRPTLIAKGYMTPSGMAYHLDIHMQGENETVFFDL